MAELQDDILRILAGGEKSSREIRKELTVQLDVGRKGSNQMAYALRRLKEASSVWHHLRGREKMWALATEVGQQESASEVLPEEKTGERALLAIADPAAGLRMFNVTAEDFSVVEKYAAAFAARGVPTWGGESSELQALAGAAMAWRLRLGLLRQDDARDTETGLYRNEMVPIVLKELQDAEIKIGAYPKKYKGEVSFDLMFSIRFL